MGPLVTPSTLPSQSPSGRSQGGGTPEDERVHLLVCTNALYLQHAVVCLTSLLVNNPDLFFDIVIVRRPLEEIDEDKLRRSLAAFSNLSLSIREFTPPSNCALPLNPRAHYTLDNWSRLWVEEFFGAEVDRVLYLDSDLVVVGSVALLWGADLSGALLGAVDIPGSQRGIMNLGMRAEDGYFNSGVLLIDLKQWRETRALDTVLNYVAANPDRLPDVDQDALNACFHGRRKRLEYKWNVIRPFFQEPLSLPLTRAEIETVCQEARVIHFNGNSKPWSYFCEHPRKGEYEKYLRMTEWHNFVPEDRTMLNIVRKKLSPIIPEKAKKYLRGLAAMISLRLNQQLNQESKPNV